MARAFGQPVDPALLESIEKEERLAKLLFKEEAKPEIVGYEKGTTFLNRKPIFEESQVLIEAEPSPPEPAPAFTPPIDIDKVQQVKNVLDTVPVVTPPSIVTTLANKEIEGIKKTLAELMKKIGTLSWGGGGTGAVRIIDQDDLDKSTVQNGRYMKYQDGWFIMDEINPYDVIHNTTLVTTNTYVVQDNDYYIGVNYAGPVIIVIPSAPDSGREIVIKDESGACENNNITVSGPVDNDANGAILAVNNGALHMLFRGDYWRII